MGIHKKSHPHEKPLDLIDIFVKNSSNEGDLILDPFLGSGTTAMACQKNNRNSIGFELSKDYCDIAKERLQQSSLFHNKESKT